MAGATVQFTLSPPALGQSVSVRLRRAGGRWVAQLDGSAQAVGIGSSARSALVAALEPLGSGAVTLLLADLALLGPSCRVLELERGAAG
ncbi:hypothetical protein BH23CHL7_BH23CHL7_09810 [soil metagenome]